MNGFYMDAVAPTGLSSEALASRGTWRRDHPWDPSDFVRCERFLRANGLGRDRLELMRAVSPEWNALVDRWDEVRDLIELEVPGAFVAQPHYGSAPRAYRMMREIIYSVGAES